MAGRRITYLALLAAAIVLHHVYGQYLTHYMVIFLLCVPLISVIASIPSALGAEAKLCGGEDVCRGGTSSVLLTLESSAHFPPEGWSVTVTSRNAFTGREDARRRIRITGERRGEMVFSPDTSQLGAVRYKIKRAFIFDHLGLIPIPIKKGSDAGIIVLPRTEQPVPEPDLAGESTCSYRPKRQGFSEEHELRPYKDGDPLNLIHWKLSRKFGELIIREPQEAVRKEIAIVIDPPSDYEQHRSVLEQLAFLNEQLMEERIPYQLQYGQKLYNINEQGDYDDFIAGTLSAPMRGERIRSIEAGKEALVYRIKPGEGVGA